MLETELQAWRQQIHELFYEARMELKGIMSELDEMISIERTRPRVDVETQAEITHREPLNLPPATAAKGSDFSLRLDYLKRKLNERLQDRPPLSDSNNSETAEESIQHVDRPRAEKQ
jgi:hypothetical protein